MINFSNLLRAWNTQDDFKRVLNMELQQLDRSQLPLQQGLAVSSRVADSDISFMLLKAEETEQALFLTILVFYSGIVVGDCCADDPTPVCEQPEQCTLRLTIHKPDGEANVTLLAEDE